jgi:hypothetical protein
MALSPGDRGRRNGNGNDPGQVPGKGETASRPFRATEDARIARVGNLLEGAGQSGTLPVGRHRDALYRSLVRFRPDWSGMGEVTRIQLRLRVSGNDRVERGDKPEIRVQRLVSGDWTEGDAVDLSTRNAVTWANQPTATAEDEVTAELPKGGGATVTFDVTELYQPLLPGDRGGEGEPDLGLVLLAKSDDGSSAERKETIEFLSSEASEGGPELLVTYEQP